MALLKLDNFGVMLRGAPVLEGVSFSLGKGQRLGVVGESGAGKSMLALAIAGLLPAGATAHGTMLFDDKPAPDAEGERAKLRGKRIGVLLQDGAGGLDPLQTAGAQVTEALTLAGASGDLTGKRDALLKDVGLEAAHEARYPRDLSGPERHCLMIALALAGEPDLLVADDPVASLDLVGQRRILDLIERVCTSRGMALVLVSHDLKAVAMLCGKIVVLHRGKAVEAGDKPEVFGHPKDDATRTMLAAGRLRARTLMRTPIGDTLLDVRHLSRRYRRPDVSIFEPRAPLVALDDISLTMRIGESIAVVGPAGAGKSTLGRIVAGLERVSRGELEFDGRVYHGIDLPRVLRRDISFVFPDPAASFNPRLTVGESIAEPLRLEEQRLMDELSARIVEVVTAVGLAPEMLGRYPHEFSTGDRQRLAIARALITRPRLVVLDEPIAALDVTARGEVLVMLNRLRADFGLTFLLLARDIEIAKVAADRVVVMDKGRIVEATTPAQLLESPREPLSKAMVAAQLPDIGIVPVF